MIIIIYRAWNGEREMLITYRGWEWNGAVGDSYLQEMGWVEMIITYKGMECGWETLISYRGWGWNGSGR